MGNGGLVGEGEALEQRIAPESIGAVEPGAACLAAAALCFAVLIVSGAWHGRGSRLIDLVASCGMALDQMKQELLLAGYRGSRPRSGKGPWDLRDPGQGCGRHSRCRDGC